MIKVTSTLPTQPLFSLTELSILGVLTLGRQVEIVTNYPAQSTTAQDPSSDSPALLSRQHESLNIAYFGRGDKIRVYLPL